MPPVVASADIRASATTVFSITTDPSRFAEWQLGVVEGHMETPESGLSVGAKCVTTRRIGFVNRPDTSDLIRYDPPRGWSVRGISGPIRALVDVDVQNLADNRSRVTISVAFEGHGLGKLLVPLVVERQAQKEMPVNVANLKALIERFT